MLDQAEGEKEECKGYIERYHEADKKAAVLEEKLKTSIAIEIIYSVGLTMGSVLIGFSAFFYNSDLRSLDPLGWLMIVIGGLLILVSIYARSKK